MTSWWVVPLIWLPITAYILRCSLVQQLDAGVSVPHTVARTGLCFLFGNFVWTVRRPLPPSSSRVAGG